MNVEYTALHKLSSQKVVETISVMQSCYKSLTVFNITSAVAECNRFQNLAYKCKACMFQFLYAQHCSSVIFNWGSVATSICQGFHSWPVKNNSSSEVTPDKVLENQHRTKLHFSGLFLHRSTALNHFC